MPRWRRRSSTATAACSRPSITARASTGCSIPTKRDATEAALRVSKLLSADEQKKVAARIAVVQRGGNAGKLLDALPASAVEADVGLRFNRIQWLRRTKDKDRREASLEDAARCAERAQRPARPQQLVDRTAHQLSRRAERRQPARCLRDRRQARSGAPAMPISKPSSSPAGSRCASSAIRTPPCAISCRCARAATSSKSIALGEYWLGRTALALGDHSSAMVHFHGAAKYPQYFYGQLGRQTLDARPAHLEVTLDPAADRRRHSELPVARRRAGHRRRPGDRAMTA